MTRLRCVVRACIERFAIWFAESFGTTTSFAVWFLLMVAWLSIIPIVGLGQWNSTWGLGGNTTESTVELFLAVATLIRANRIDHHTAQQMNHIEALLEHLGVELDGRRRHSSRTVKCHHCAQLEEAASTSRPTSA